MRIDCSAPALGITLFPAINAASVPPHGIAYGKFHGGVNHHRPQRAGAQPRQQVFRLA